MDRPGFDELLARARAGDQDAAEGLFDSCEPYLRKLLGRRMDAVFRHGQIEPSDILQDVYASAWDALPPLEFEGRAAFLGWLRTITLNRLKDVRAALLALKRGAARKKAESGNAQSFSGRFIEQLAASSSTPSRRAARAEGINHLKLKLWRLPPDYRQVIQWRFLEHIPVKEVAERLNRSEPAVHMLCHRALKSLRELMGPRSRYMSSD